MQKPSRLVSLPLALGLILTIAAVAQTSEQQTTPSSQPQTTAPAQSPSAQPTPATPSGAQPSTGSSGPQSNTGSTSAQPSTRQGGNGHSIDQELQLSEDQKQKIAAVVDDENRQIETLRNDNSLSLEQKQQKVLAIRQSGSPKIKAILTPEQLQKLAAIQQRMRQQQGGNENSPQGQPQR